MLAACLLATTLLTACSSYRVRAPDRPGATDHSKIVWSYAWGLVPGLPEVDCPSKLLAEVTVDSHVGFDLIGIITLGLASPKKVSWTCARPQTTNGVIDLGVADNSASRPTGDSANEAGGGV